MIDAAIVGLGRWGRNFVESLHGQSERLRFVRGVDAAPDKARAFTEKFGLPLVADYAAALADPALRAFVLCTPHSLHRPQVEAAARAGKPVFCEKPLALNLADARAMVDACRKAGVVLGVGHNRRLWPAMQELKRLTASGALGAIQHIEGHYSNEHSNNTAGTWRDSPAESPGGGLTGAGLHILDAFVNLIGAPRRVHGWWLTRKPPPVARDTAMLMFDFPNDVSGQLATVRATPHYWRVHVFGDKGSAEARGETELLVHRSGAEPERFTYPPVNALRLQLEAFADAIEGRAPFPVSPDDMLATVRTFEAAVRALETNTAVDLPAG
ncbi:MAG: Gfo/Idh/MocA family protein [Burkholderiales bacterium]